MKKAALAAAFLAAVLVCAAGCESGMPPENAGAPVPEIEGETAWGMTSRPDEQEETAASTPPPTPALTPETTPIPTPDSISSPPASALEPASTPKPPNFTTKMSYEELVADDGDRTELKEVPTEDGYLVEVDLTNCVVTVYAPDGSVALQALCTVGKKDSPTPAGEFTMGGQRERFGLFNKYDCYAQYWSQIEGDIFFHSVLYDEPDGDTLIKGTYRNLGKATSHGCVRLTVPDAKWIYENVGVGSRVIIREKDKDPELRKSLKLPKAP